MIRHKLHLDTDQTPAGGNGKKIRCPYCGRILTEVLAVAHGSLHRLYCRSKGCKLYFLLESSEEDEKCGVEQR